MVKVILNLISKLLLALILLANLATAESSPEEFKFSLPNFRALSIFACSFVGTVSNSLFQVNESLFYKLKIEILSPEKAQVTGNCGIRVGASNKVDQGQKFTLTINTAELHKALNEDKPIVIKGLVGNYRFRFNFKTYRDVNMRLMTVLEHFNYYASAQVLAKFNLEELVEQGSESLSPNSTSFRANSWLDQGLSMLDVLGMGARSGQATLMWSNLRGSVFITQQSIPQYEWGSGRKMITAEATQLVSDLVFIETNDEYKWKGCSVFSGSQTKHMSEDKCYKLIKQYGI